MFRVPLMIVMPLVSMMALVTEVRGVKYRLDDHDFLYVHDGLDHSWAPMVKKTSIGSIPIID
jgi:hypothetical protein